MCFICTQKPGFETDLSKILQINHGSSLEVNEGINSNSTNKSLQSIDLITDWADDIKTDFAGLETIYYYIHNSYGETFENYGLPSYEISESHDSGDEKFIENAFQSIDGYIELDFERTYSKSQGNIDIYYIGPFEVGEIAGIVITDDLSDSNVDVFWENQYGYS